MWACIGNEDNQRWYFDTELGLLMSLQAGPTPAVPFVVSACGGNAY